jgi:hypothetical protein|tara:strand:- start:42 stop:314 length:273 start_codon:yes stop_codon:yes gene_type:complete
VEDIYAILDIKLANPYYNSSLTVADFAILWHCRIIKISTIKRQAILAIHWKKFKDIFGTNPHVGEFEVPINTEHFIDEVKVIHVVALKME